MLQHSLFHAEIISAVRFPLVVHDDDRVSDLRIPFFWIIT